MGFFLGLLYFITSYLTPPVVFGPLAAYRIELVLAALIFVVSLFFLARSFVTKAPQSLAMVGLILAVPLSVFVGQHYWLGGAVQAFLDFVPSAFAFFVVGLFFTTRRRLQVLVAALLFVCLFVIARGWMALESGVLESAPAKTGDSPSPYFLAMQNESGQYFYRLRGLGEINDPNDFSQLIVSVVPLVFIFWRPKRPVRNLVFVLLPILGLLYGAYLTHSRGSLVALMAVLLVAARRRIGTLPAAVLAGLLFLSASALNYSGGRDISVESGADRTALWGESMEQLRAHPLFGVGFGELPNYLEGGHTAHNSVMVCAAELGLTGLFSWCLFLFPTVRDAMVIASPEKVSEASPNTDTGPDVPYRARKMEALDKVEINRLGRLLLLSLTGYLVAGWFLSRAFVMTFFLLGGMSEVVFEMARQRGMVPSRLPLARTMIYSVILAISLLLLMYISLRSVNLVH
jgi:hypothetical protein